MSNNTEHIQKGLMQMAIREAEQQGAGILMVEADKPPFYVELKDVMPVPLRESLSKTHAQDGGAFCYMGFVDQRQVHVIKVARTVPQGGVGAE
jgi:hypothetical protein